MTFRRLAAAAVAGLAIASAAVLALADPPREGFAPDPPVHVSEKQWVFEVSYEKGASSITSARSATSKTPMGTARVMGRFALEFRVGKELLDRVRFDVPLLGDDARERDPKRPFGRPTFSRVTTKVKVQMADHSRATTLAFVDRATGTTRTYFWPPDEKGQLTPFSAKAATTSTPATPPADAATDSPPGDGAAPTPTATSTIAGASPEGGSPPSDASAGPDSAPRDAAPDGPAR